MRALLHARTPCPAIISVVELQSLRLFSLKQRLWNPRLPNDALQSSSPEFIVKRNRHGDSCVFRLKLHDAVASVLAHRDKSVLLENFADLRT